MSAHTPGPWMPFVMVNQETGAQMTPEQVGELVKNSIIKSAIQSGTNEYVFVVAKKHDGEYDICHVGNGPDRKANARLIAAAPELLAFAKWAIGQLCGDSGTGESHWEQFQEFRDGQSAIAKAEGQT